MRRDTRINGRKWQCSKLGTVIACQRMLLGTRNSFASRCGVHVIELLVEHTMRSCWKVRMNVHPKRWVQLDVLLTNPETWSIDSMKTCMCKDVSRDELHITLRVALCVTLRAVLRVVLCSLLRVISRDPSGVPSSVLSCVPSIVPSGIPSNVSK